MKKAKYQTRQLTELKNYFLANKHKHAQAQEIYQYLNSKDISISLATVYRQLDKMVEMGLLTKYVVDYEKGALYEWKHPHQEEAFHCKCEKCGELIHVKCEELTLLQAHISRKHAFAINASKLVFYGLCKRCATNLEMKES